jgi:3-phosphoshikimate 1-carboxyvinyltransferase
VFACVPAILGGSVRLGPVAAADRGLEALARAGAKVAAEGDGLVVSGPAEGPIELDAEPDPDLVPPLAIAAIFARGTSRFRRVGRLRAKESDRVSGLLDAIAALRGEGRLEGDDLIVEGGRKLAGAALSTRHDHRLAMSLSIAGLALRGVSIDDASCVAKSMGDFFPRLEAAVG